MSAGALQLRGPTSKGKGGEGKGPTSKGGGGKGREGGACPTTFQELPPPM